MKDYIKNLENLRNRAFELGDMEMFRYLEFSIEMAREFLKLNKKVK